MAFVITPDHSKNVGLGFYLILLLFKIIQLWSKSMRIEKTTYHLRSSRLSYISSFVYGVLLLSSCKKFPSGFFVRFWSGQFVKPIHVGMVLSFFWHSGRSIKGEKVDTLCSRKDESNFHSPYIARFIWNAEISISVAIHCYERLF